MGDTFVIPDPDDFECIKRVFSCTKPHEKEEPIHEQIRSHPEAHKVNLAIYDVHPGVGITIDTIIG